MSLTGKRILITRSRQQASELAARLEAAGAESILIPTIEIAPPASFRGLDAALASIRNFDWVIFTSTNAVHAFQQRAALQRLMPRPKHIAVIGPATAKAVQAIGLTVNLTPPRYVAEVLAEALKPFAAGSTMLLIRAEQARDVLPEALTTAGATLTIATAYRTIIPPDSIAILRRALAEEQSYPDAITFTSASTATNLAALLESGGLKLPESIVRASIGPITSRTLHDLGWPPTIEAAEATIPSLCEALDMYFR